MRTDLFDFELPEELIALEPVSPRDASRLLVVEPGSRGGGGPLLSDRVFRELPDLLEPGDCLVFNDTRVIPAALQGVRVTTRAAGGRVAQPQISANLHKRLGPSDWLAFVKPARRLREGDELVFSGGLQAAGAVGGTGAVRATGLHDASGGNGASLGARVVTMTGQGEAHLRFEAQGAALDAALARVAEMPLPPYIAGRRPVTAADVENYQTVYAEKDGAVAAPTAGLHFTQRVFDALVARGIGQVRVTLHVGAGTFLPVKVEDTREHQMHSEWGEVTDGAAEALNRVRQTGGRVVCVGTTSLRLVESAAAPDGRISSFRGDTDIFITPGYRFRIADGLITNFHLPRSTLFMLVSALAGLETMQTAYAHAIAERYRFYSYGDSSLLWRGGELSVVDDHE